MPPATHTNPTQQAAHAKKKHCPAMCHRWLLPLAEIVGKPEALGARADPPVVLAPSRWYSSPKIPRAASPFFPPTAVPPTLSSSRPTHRIGLVFSFFFEHM